MHDDPSRRAVPTASARSDGDLVDDPRSTTFVAIAMLTAVAALTIVVVADTVSPPFLQGLDDAWRRRVLAWPDLTRSLGDLFEQVGASVVMVALRIAVAAWLAFRRRRWDLAAWLVGWIMADVLTAVLKPGIARQRPTRIDPDNPFTSFPSAHAKTAAQVAIGSVLVLTDPCGRRRWWYAVAFAWVVLMALSRTVVDHHWLSDVVAGSMLGAGCMLLASATLQTVRGKRAPEPFGG
ncbi:MAG: phosphatase PAP2 family protein [Actinomycetota bacterium]